MPGFSRYATARGVLSIIERMTQRTMVTHGINPTKCTVEDYIEWKRMDHFRICQLMRNRGIHYKYEDKNVFACKCHNVLKDEPEPNTHCGLCGGAVVNPYTYPVATPYRPIDEGDVQRAYDRMMKSMNALKDFEDNRRREKVEKETNAHLKDTESAVESVEKYSYEIYRRLREELRQEAARREAEYEALIKELRDTRQERISILDIPDEEKSFLRKMSLYDSDD